MDAKTAYVSSIPAEAKERIAAKYKGGARKRAEYYLNGEHVGTRQFFPSGELTLEYSYKNGVRHGIFYRWDAPGELLSADPYENDVEHGTAYQWGSDGRLIGTYTMEHGTGIDLWWADWEDGSVTLQEVRYMKDGERHGFEWWLYDETLSHELHCKHGLMHGIERKWNSQERLHRGYPRYWVEGEQMTKAKYLRRASKDPTLPPFRAEDNKPYRTFPPEVAKHLRPPVSQIRQNSL